MNKIYEVKTIEEAKKLAVSEFGICEEDIEFNIVKENKGFLGIGAKLEVEAKVVADGIEKGKQYTSASSRQSRPTTSLSTMPRPPFAAT